MTSYMIEPITARPHNLILVLELSLFILFLIAVAISEMSLFFIVPGVWLINVAYLKNEYAVFTTPVPTAIPIAKVIWTQHWENETIKIVIPDISTNYGLYLFNITMRFYANIWDELHVKSLDNTDKVLYNYNAMQPVIGIKISDLPQNNVVT